MAKTRTTLSAVSERLDRDLHLGERLYAIVQAEVTSIGETQANGTHTYVRRMVGVEVFELTEGELLDVGLDLLAKCRKTANQDLGHDVLPGLPGSEVTTTADGVVVTDAERAALAGEEATAARAGDGPTPPPANPHPAYRPVPSELVDAWWTAFTKDGIPPAVRFDHVWECRWALDVLNTWDEYAGDDARITVTGGRDLAVVDYGEELRARLETLVTQQQVGEPWRDYSEDQVGGIVGMLEQKYSTDRGVLERVAIHESKVGGKNRKTVLSKVHELLDTLDQGGLDALAGPE